MFRWLNRKAALPPVSKANPGQGTSFRVGFSNADRSWEDQADVLVTLAAVLESRGIQFGRKKERLEFANGLIARPQFVELQPRDDGLVRTATTVELNHPELCPIGTFEFQHSFGSNLDDALQKGFASWAEIDLPVFMDALRDEPQTCSLMVKECPANASFPARTRQIILGPPMHTVAREVSERGEAHDFCPCCLLTNCIDAFLEKIEGDRFYGIRLFAARNADGTAEADCRIDGVDWPPGKAALLKYAATWPARGFEFRKQFVAIRTVRAR